MFQIRSITANEQKFFVVCGKNADLHDLALAINPPQPVLQKKPRKWLRILGWLGVLLLVAALGFSCYFNWKQHQNNLMWVGQDEVLRHNFEVCQNDLQESEEETQYYFNLFQEEENQRLRETKDLQTEIYSIASERDTCNYYSEQMKANLDEAYAFINDGYIGIENANSAALELEDTIYDLYLNNHADSSELNILHNYAETVSDSFFQLRVDFEDFLP